MRSLFDTRTRSHLYRTYNVGDAIALRGDAIALLIKRHRVEKSLSPFGKVQMQCRWSGKITQASILKGWFFIMSLKAFLNKETFEGIHKNFLLL
ncbi:hypothetical protein NDI37_15750 [Funiculus sociatus GB2-A5]|uniref:Uncharacterized protein n=1 Tax=Funiculus sociatus GB2-A5 TaxID=2933946 RepID=A0ABV0JR95_9CYAN|nr:hypothetical protein [Trichocoleus sp. FACHB-6]